ncbi:MULTISPECIES: hypothetical protein [Methanobacterium]|uniref:SWIM-type domain-containing protein n=1 Tax=Methanobacterium veterum TaxID=408577 RepID=A0A9E5DMB3_9EURY|nr:MULTISPECIES: hypothetical protein [Methanobacterium]MCZ3364890.1 hypothetical protein [Methanobacterium veterum]MCZ3372645.1 hypothetical protein [Methanobacterium veterum]
MNKRDIKAERLFKNGGVKKIGKDKYEVQGSRRVHTVKKIAGYWICPCEDHQFRFEKCYHIRACIKYELKEKKRTSQGNFFNNKYKTLLMKKRALSEQVDKINMDNRAYLKLFGEKSSELSEKKVKFYNRLIEIEKELKKVSPNSRTIIIG